MTRTLLVVLVLAGVGVVHAQERATTESGRQVLLFPDGTWKYAPTTSTPGSHDRPAQATSEIALARGAASLYYDPAKWRRDELDDPTRARLAHVTGDGYAIIIAERIEMTLDALREVALSNARSAAPDAAITWEERRVVNGTEVLAARLRGTTQGITFVYFGYYYAGPQGTFQVLTYTSSNLFDEYRDDFEELLNGFVVTP